MSVGPSRKTAVAPPLAEAEADAPGATPAFDRFYRNEFHAVVGLAYALSGSRLAAEELAQDAFLAAHQRWDRISAYDSPRAWVRRVVTNAARSRLRRRVAETKALARWFRQRIDRPDELPENDERFWREARALPEMQSKCVVLRYWEDFDVSEIAGVLECAESTVRVHLHRGRRRLAERLGCDPVEEP